MKMTFINVTQSQNGPFQYTPIRYPLFCIIQITHTHIAVFNFAVPKANERCLNCMWVWADRILTMTHCFPPDAGDNLKLIFSLSLPLSLLIIHTCNATYQHVCIWIQTQLKVCFIQSSCVHCIYALPIQSTPIPFGILYMRVRICACYVLKWIYLKCRTHIRHFN